MPLGAGADAGDDLQRLACRAAGPSGAAVRGVLLEELADLDPRRVDELSMAWRRVAWALQEAGEEEALRSFHGLSRERLREREDLQGLLKGFPPPPRGLSDRLDVGLSSN